MAATDLPRPVSAADLALTRRIDELHLEHPFMCARMLGDQLHREAMQAYLDWKFGLVEQLARDGTHGFRVI